MYTLKMIANLFPGYVTLLVHGSGMGTKMSAGNLEIDYANKIVKTIIPLGAYRAEIIVED